LPVSADIGHLDAYSQTFGSLREATVAVGTSRASNFMPTFGARVGFLAAPTFIKSSFA
jgi:hypothetical protein